MDISTLGQKSNLFVQLDKHVTLKFLKEVKTSRTYIGGLGDFMTNEQIEIFTKQLKKKLGAGMNTKLVNGKTEYGFQGNHIDSIKKILLSETEIPEEKIKSS